MPSSPNADASRPDGAGALDHDAQLAELFDLDVAGVVDDVPFYQALARAAGGPLLEIGAGSGRVAVPLARAGFDVWGIDTSDAMLARARCKAGDLPNLRLVRADMRDLHLDEQFALAYAAFGTFHHLRTPGDQLACLQSVARHLAPGGLFVCDMRPIWFADWEEGDSVPLLHDWTRVLPRTGETVMKLRSARADIERRLQHETHVYDCIAADGALRRVVMTTDLRYTTPSDMDGLLREAGLVLEDRYGDYDRSQFDDDSELMITVARKPAGKEAS